MTIFAIVMSIWPWLWLWLFAGALFLAIQRNYSVEDSEQSDVIGSDRKVNNIMVAAFYFFPFWWIVLCMAIVGALNYLVSMTGNHLYQYVPTPFFVGLWLAGYLVALVWTGRSCLNTSQKNSALIFLGMFVSWFIVWECMGMTQGSVLAGLERAAGKPYLGQFR